MKMLKTETAAIAIAVFLTNSTVGGVVFKSIQISLKHFIFYAAPATVSTSFIHKNS
jgi:hypothetical protein